MSEGLYKSLEEATETTDVNIFLFKIHNMNNCIKIHNTNYFLTLILRNILGVIQNSLDPSHL